MRHRFSLLTLAATLATLNLLAPRPAQDADTRDRGDVPGWVLVTIMTAGLVIGIWAVAAPQLEGVFAQAIDRVFGDL